MNKENCALKLVDEIILFNMMHGRKNIKNPWGWSNRRSKHVGVF